MCGFAKGNYIDYKGFDAYNVTLRCRFGYGLSYTAFAYGDLSVTIINSPALASTYPTGALAVGGKADLWNEVASGTITVVNNGTVDGNKVPQLYVQYPDVADHPVRQLRGFGHSGRKGFSSAATSSVKRRNSNM